MAYWLFKSEPNCYAFADLLAAPDRTTGWDGVRNFQARNFLRDAIRVGDGVLFYHSNADPPAIAGIAEVVVAAHPDPTAFDPRAEHHDPRSDPSRPTWYQVAIRGVRALECSRGHRHRGRAQDRRHRGRRAPVGCRVTLTVRGRESVRTMLAR